MCTRHHPTGLGPSVLFITLIAAICSATVEAQVLYVDDDAPFGGDGLSWDTPFKYLQDALHTAADDPSITEIRVAQGTYKPDQDEAGNVTPGDREATFQLISGLALRGGYAGITEPDPDARDIDLYVTILTGDLAGDDGPDYIEDFVACFSGYDVPLEPGCEAFDFDGDNDVDRYDFPAFRAANNYDENGHHVVTGSGTDQTATLDGVTITAGVTHGDQSRGAGMFNSGGSPTLTGCTFHGNSGSGMCNQGGSNPVLTDCTFSRNWAAGGAGIVNRGSSPTLIHCLFVGNACQSGGGMHNSYHSSPTLVDCTFAENLVDFGGGGMYNEDSSPRLTNCTFVGNSAPGRDFSAGAAVFNTYGDPELINCLISGNSALYAGGIYNNCSRATLTNCTLIGNSAEHDGGAIFNAGWYGDYSIVTLVNCTLVGNSAGERVGAVYDWRQSETSLTSCIVWDNTAGDDRQLRIFGTVSYSCVQGGWVGEGNIDADPLFVDPDNDDYHLSSDSLCINAGSNYVPELPDEDIEGNPRIQHCRVDMGSYESPYPGTFEDCNQNDVDDDCDIYEGTSEDCNQNHVPDECEEGWELDCNENGAPDFCDIYDGTSEDCQLNGIPDECDIRDGTSEDCNENAVPDECEWGGNEDCNENGVPDLCDIYYGTSHDWNANGIPDECECVGDVTGDGDTDEVDLAFLLAWWGECEGDPGYDPAGDLNADGCINHADLGVLLSDWGCTE